MKCFLISACLTFFIFPKADAQNIDSTIEKYGNEYGQERAYLHYDKSNYAPGETVWFKAYLMQGIFPVIESKTLYIDWTDDKGTLLLHSSTPIVDGTAIGQNDIPNNYTGEFIHIRAYTKWMLNFDSSFLYDKDIRVLTKSNIPKASKFPIIPSIQFFPEGGNLIANVSNKVAFKANDQYGRPVIVKGIIQKKTGGTLDSLRTIHDG
ncbi:MAG: hypothetical protein ABIO81_03285, partial [Ginsengibacter sp.]